MTTTELATVSLHPTFGQLRTWLEDDGTVTFCGRDAATALGYQNPKDALRRHCKGVAKHYPLQTEGGVQKARFISEGDLYRLIVNSQLPAARRFEKWVFDEVLPSIRKTGVYSTKPNPGPGLSEDEIVHQALQITTGRIKQLEAELVMKNEQLAARDEQLDRALPKANTWDAICSGRGDHTITDAAKLLSSAGVVTGPRKLHAQLQDLGWIHKDQRGRWAAYQDRLNAGLLAEKARHYLDDDGVMVTATPQVRVTPKGLQRLRELLAPIDVPQLAVLEGGLA
ncbi:MAG: phage antirepressor KilAC domain-containing protein [Propionibacteriaceae bacterium]|nr:phage antirepressor KilAC domain-containing protein [Propionibacteriaceae bacterium]